MTCMDFHQIETSVYSTFCCCTIVFCNADQFFFCQRSGFFPTCFRRNIRCRNRLHSNSAAHSRCTCMVQLDTDACTMSVTCFCQIEKTRNVAVFVNTQLRGTIGTLRIFHTDVFHQNQACAAFCPQFIIFDVFVAQLAVMTCQVTSHWHHNNTVPYC